MTTLAEETCFCVVSDAVEGATLLEHVRERGHLDVAEALTIGRQIAQGMGALHRLGVIHGDLRATNITLVRSASNDGADARPVVCELGLTTLALEAEGCAPSLRAMMLSPENIAPEQIRDEPITAATDVYAFGTILHRMLTGTAAFHGDNVSQTLRAHLTRAPAMIKDRVPDAPDSVEALVAKCLARRPEDRYPSFDALLAQLHECEARVLSIASIRSPAWTAARPPVTPSITKHHAASEPEQQSAEEPSPATSVEDHTPSQSAPIELTLADAEISDAPKAAVVSSKPARRSLRTTRSFLMRKRGFRFATLLTLALGSAGGFIASSQLASRTAIVASARTVRFSVHTNARGATVTIRGRSYPAPIEIEFAPGTEPEVVEVRAPRYASRSVAMILDHSMRVDLDLDLSAPAEPSPR